MLFGIPEAFPENKVNIHCAGAASAYRKADELFPCLTEAKQPVLCAN